MNGLRRRIGPHRGGAWLVLGFLMLAGCAPNPDQAALSTRIGTTSIARGSASPPRFTAAAFLAADGLVLPLRKWLPPRGDKVKAVILALHGFNDYSKAFEAPAAAWAEQGIATYAYDQRGFGAAPERGRWTGRFALAADAAAASRILRRLYPGVPLYLLGESMGGAVAIVAMAGESGASVPDVDGAILAAPAVWGRATMGPLPRVALWVGVRLLPGLTLTGRGLKIRASDNVAMLRALSRDPLVIKETRVDTIYGLVNLMDAALAAAPHLHTPLLVLYGAEDQIVPSNATRRFVEALPVDAGQRRSFAFYAHGYHMLLRDLEGPLVAADVAGWVLDPRAPLISGADRGAAEAVLSGAGRAPQGGG